MNRTSKKVMLKEEMLSCMHHGLEKTTNFECAERFGDDLRGPSIYKIYYGLYT